MIKHMQILRKSRLARRNNMRPSTTPTPCRIAVGDKVLVRLMKNESRKGGKIEPQFTGPYTVAEDIGKGRYHLKDNKGKLLNHINI